MAGANNLGKRSYYGRRELPLDPSMLNEPRAPSPRPLHEIAFYVGMTIAIGVLILSVRWLLGGAA